ncbi:MAG: MFS transporter [Anaerolineae bacterium]
MSSSTRDASPHTGSDRAEVGPGELRKEPGGPTKAVQRALVFSRAFYAFFFAAGAFLSPFLALYFDSLGLRGSQIGVLRGLSPLITVGSAPLWGALADATRRDKLIRLVTMSVAWVAVLGVALTNQYAVLIGMIALYAFFGAPVMPLVDNAVIALLGSDSDRYGQQRLWGAVGWGPAGLLAGLLIDRFGLSVAFVGYLILMGLAGVMALAIPAAGDAADSHKLPGSGALSEIDFAVRRSFWQDLRRLFFNRSWMVFLLTILVGGMFLAVEMNYLFLYLDTLGASETLMGFALVLTTVSEVPIWALAPRLLRRWGPRGLLTAALLAAIVQALAYSWMQAAWIALPVQLLHGLAFPAMWAAGVAYAARSAPPGTKATAQGAYNAVQMGLSVAIGAFLGGLLIERVGGAVTFRLTAVTSLVALGLVWLGTKPQRDVGSRGGEASVP